MTWIGYLVLENSLIISVFIFVGSIIMNHKYIGNYYFWISVLDDHLVYHQLTEEDVILCDQVEKLLYTAMKQLMPTSDDGK